MANTITNNTIEDTTLEAIDPDRFARRDGIEIMLVAHKMCEAYLGKDMSYKLVTVTYQVDDLSSPLPAVKDYPINVVNSVINVNSDKQDFTFNDRFIFGTWSSPPIVAQYKGGLPTQVYDAIFRQAKVLDSRLDLAPEETIKELGPIKYSANTMYRTGLAPDVKQMLFPFRVIGF